MKKLGFGLMRLPVLDKNDPASIDYATCEKMTDMFLERGFTYFDTAWMYHNFESENAVRKFLVVRHARDTFALADKLHAGFFETKEEYEEIFKTQLKKTGAGYFDYYLLHDMNTMYYEKYTKLGCFDWLVGLKEKGLAKHIGFSFHEGPELLERILSEHPELDFVQLQINYLDWESRGIQSRKCYEVARKYGKAITVMEPVKGGLLAMLPAKALAILKEVHPDWSEAEWAIKFVASLPGVQMVLSGMSDLAQLDDNTSFMKDFPESLSKENEPAPGYHVQNNLAPYPLAQAESLANANVPALAPYPASTLTLAERTALANCVDIINSDIKIACTGCSYCTDGCARSIPIPQYFSLYNSAAKELEQKYWNASKTYYWHISETKNKASDCIECGQCELICPQHLPVIKWLKDVAEYFE